MAFKRTMELYGVSPKGLCMEQKKVTTEKEPKTVIQNCNFTGVKWDSQAIEAVNTVAKALLNLTKLFESQNIHIETLLTVADADKK